ncbi:MarR family transcriptional regulator [Ferrimonas balearica]|uniref:MarR family transcriptional regulator n=1 Tax=Ferrimonas balearica TaxID=44012 RepID=UPI001C98528A|nr:helix-turn-helix domain-containing protein [Ferrimonas balearica]MBY6104976.1 MarR family transcriptional regulator [Ferrimonas balearica]
MINIPEGIRNADGFKSVRHRIFVALAANQYGLTVSELAKVLGHKGSTKDLSSTLNVMKKNGWVDNKTKAVCRISHYKSQRWIPLMFAEVPWEIEEE